MYLDPFLTQPVNQYVLSQSHRILDQAKEVHQRVMLVVNYQLKINLNSHVLTVAELECHGSR